MSNKKRLFLLALTAALALSGCGGKKESEADHLVWSSYQHNPEGGGGETE